MSQCTFTLRTPQDILANMGLDVPTQTWRREGLNYLVSTDVDLIPIDDVNKMFGSDLMWWASELPRDIMLQSLRNSLNFALYEEVKGEENGPNENLSFVGFARLITDGTTFAYMTDVGILREHQGKGLGRFLMECVHEVISSWPHLRRFMLLASDSMDLYRKTLGVQDSREFSESIGVGMRDGPSGKHPDH